MDQRQIAELTLGASDKTDRSLMASAADNDGYQQLLKMIQIGFPPSTAALSPAVRAYAGYADELGISSGRVFTGHRVIVPPKPDLTFYDVCPTATSALMDVYDTPRSQFTTLVSAQPSRHRCRFATSVFDLRRRTRRNH